MNTKLRVDAFYEMKDLIQKLKPIYRSCLYCEHFDELNGEQCKLAKARPPARVICYGCEKFEDMEIPF